MAKSKLYDCYSYIMVNSAHNTYPIRNAECHLERLFSLQYGDILYIKGIGDLQFLGLFVDDYEYREKGKDGLYQEVGIKCRIIEY